MIYLILFILALAAPQAEIINPTPTIVKSGTTCVAPNPIPKSPFRPSPILKIMFKNNLKVDVCWSGFRGNRIWYGRLRPNQQLAAITFVGHVWNFRLVGERGCHGNPFSDPVSYNLGGLKLIDDMVKACPTKTPLIPAPTLKTASTLTLTIDLAPPFNPNATPTLTTASSPTPTGIVLADYQALEKSFKESFINSAKIPKHVRMAFHDLAKFDPNTNPLGGPDGCIFDKLLPAFLITMV